MRNYGLYELLLPLIVESLRLELIYYQTLVEYSAPCNGTPSTGCDLSLRYRSEIHLALKQSKLLAAIGKLSSLSPSLRLFDS
jgi:hypothetical protein